jgi:hypothetical protein
MAGGVAVPVHVEVLGVEVGHWCRTCLLGSGMRVWYVNRTLGSLCLHSATGCTEDDHDDVELTEQPSTIWRS